MKRLIFRFLFVVAIASLASSEAVAVDIELEHHFTVTPDRDHFKKGNPGDQVRAFRIHAVGAKEGTPAGSKHELTGPIFRPQGAAVNEQGNYWKIYTQDKDGEHEVKYKVWPVRNSAGEVSGILLVPQGGPKKGAEYYIIPRGGEPLDSILEPQYHVTNSKDFLTKPVPIDNEDADIAYVEGNKAIEPNVSLKAGKDSTASLKLLYGHQVFANESILRFQSIFDADLTAHPKTKTEFINKINGEIDLLYDTPPWPHNTWLSALSEIGISSRLEADQRFDNVDQTVGLTTYTAFNGDVLQRVADLLCLNGSLGGNAPSALLGLSYEYVGNITNDPTTGARGTHVTTDRARAQFYWSTTILQNLDWRAFPITKDIYDLSLVFDTGIAYDRLNAKFLPDINLTLELGPADPKSKNVSFVVTYVNGKTKARFENYNGVLAGLKKTF
jgi:hypothetical protein